MSKKLAGKVALVTGGSRGIGAAVARALAAEGADVALSYVASAEKAETLAQELRDTGVRAAAFQADQADPAAAAALVQDVARQFGKLDILVNNAGVAVFSATDDPQADTAALARQFSVNVAGVIAGTRAAAAILGEGGRIITIGSVAGEYMGFPGAAEYSATKAAVAGYTRGAARDLAPRQITVNVVQPGPVETDMAPGGELAELLKSKVALGRFGRVEEIAAGVVFLASPEASYITGATLTIDGGYSV